VVELVMTVTGTVFEMNDVRDTFKVPDPTSTSDTSATPLASVVPERLAPPTVATTGAPR
jgi:hypothetical protein